MATLVKLAKELVDDEAIFDSPKYTTKKKKKKIERAHTHTHEREKRLFTNPDYLIEGVNGTILVQSYESGQRPKR